MNDKMILQLVAALDGHIFPVDSVTNDIEYFVTDVELVDSGKVYRII
jgi:hypothetical protein